MKFELGGRGGSPALCSKTATIDYRTFSERAAALGEALDALGGFPGEGVALLSSGRAHDEPIALWGMLERGSVVIPLDASAPPARHFFILGSRGVRTIVLDEAGAKLAQAIDEEARAAGEEIFAKVFLDASGRVASVQKTERSVSTIQNEEDLACILHTSGSTGAPKPVPITRQGIFSFTDWMIDLVSLTEKDRVLRVAELVFDLAWFDHVATFRKGAALCTMPRRDVASGRAQKEAMAALGPTIVYGVPGFFTRLASTLGTDERLDDALRIVMYAGEVFPPRELSAFSSKLSSRARLFNLYGPTETNVCTFHEVDRAKLDGESEIPIGVPCPYAHCELRDESDRRRIEGPGTGELVVSGSTTIHGGPHATGDRVERGEDGLFYFRGRLDRMLKIRGYRVEPLEVESQLEAHPAVQKAAIVPRQDPRLGRTLWAFIALRPGAPADERELRVFLGERLPPYMVPERIVALEELPRTATGKIDYRALNDP